MKVEYKIRRVTRFIVTRFQEDDAATTGSSIEVGTYPNADVAYEVGYALAKAEHERLGYEPGDERIQYPQQTRNAAQLDIQRAGAVLGGAMLTASEVRG